MEKKNWCQKTEYEENKVSTFKKTGKENTKRIPILHTTSVLAVDPGQDSWQIVKRLVVTMQKRK